MRPAQSGGERGASIVELALIAPVMVLIVMGIIDLARGYQMQIQLENAAREGAAFAQTRPNAYECASSDDIVARASAEEPGVASLPDFRVEVFAQDGSGDLTEPVTGCDGTAAEAGDRVRVVVSATFELLVPMVEQAVGGDIDISASADVEVQG